MADIKYNWVDNCCVSGIAKCDTDVLNDCLMYLKYENSSTGYEVGDIVFRVLPTSDSSKHLLDGTVLDGQGVFKDFVEYIANLYKSNPSANFFTTESNWQASVEQYGVCGKFVYDSTANTVRLPKVTGFVEGTLDANTLGDLVEQFVKLPNITGAFETSDRGHVTTGAFYTTSGATARGDNNGGSAQWINLDASRASSVYSGNGTDTKIQPQSIKGYMYIVVATTAKTDIEVNIDNIVTDLNQKVDISNMVDAKSEVINWNALDYSSEISFTWGTNFTAPSNGIIMLGRNGYGGATAGYYWTLNNGSRHCFGGNNSGVFQMVIPVSKGDVLSMVGGNNDAGNYSYFYPVKGAN